MIRRHPKISTFPVEKALVNLVKHVSYHDFVDVNGLMSDFHKSIATTRNHISEAISKNSKNADERPQLL
jgi:hypothetical protein